MGVSLHVLWLPNALYLWGEDSERFASAQAVAGEGAVDGASGAIEHPFAASADALRALVGEFSDDSLLADVAKASTLLLELPFEAGKPAASPWLAALVSNPTGDGVAAAAAARHNITIPCLSLGPAEAVDWLLSLPDPLPESWGDSVRYWNALARFAVESIAHKQFVPNMTEVEPGRYAARWRVIAQDPIELDWLERMVLAMPASCQAARLPQSVCGTHANVPDAAALAETFLSSATDGLVRRSVATDPFFHTPAERSAEPDAPPETRWLAALLGNDPIVSASAADNALLSQMVESWTGQLEDANSASSMQLQFVLEEPEFSDEDEVKQAATEGGTEGQTADSSAAATTSSPEESTASAGDADASERPWRLRLQLKNTESDANAEESTIDAAELWQESGAGTLLARNVKARRTRFLAELTRAATLFPPATTLLSYPAPIGMDLTIGQANAFIRQWAPVLREADFGVILPEWAWHGTGALGLRLMVRPLEGGDGELELAGAHGRKGRRGLADDPFSQPTSGHFGLDALLQFDWQIALGDLRLSSDEFLRLAERNVPLVRYRGRWVQIELEQARKALNFIERQKDKTLTLGEAIRTAYGAAEGEAGLPVLGMTGTSWIDQLLEQAPSAQIEPVEQPAGFAGTMRPYQLRGLQWMAFLDRMGIGCCLADDMGLGKTIQLIALLLQERHRAEGENQDASQQTALRKPGPTLLFAPTSVVGNWVREIQRFAGSLKVFVHHGPQRPGGQEFADAAKDADVVVTTYALAHRDREDFKRIDWWRLALDEAQKIKNPAAASTVAIRSLAAGRRVALTGTPIENHLSELWSIMEVLNPGLLGPPGEFRERFAVPIEKLGDKERSERLRQMIRPFVLRRLKSDPDIAGDLPEKMEMRIFCNLTPEQAALYERIVADSMVQIDAATGIRRRGLILSVLTRLKQLCDHPLLLTKEHETDSEQPQLVPTRGRRRRKGSGRQFSPKQLDMRSGKCERLVEMLEEVIGEGDAALVFTQFREMGHILENLITRRLQTSVLFLHGGTPAKERDAMVETFQGGGDGRRNGKAPAVFILSLRAGGLGLNLTAANHVFHFDRWWNPAVEQQATDRAHRVGQTRKVQVHKFVCIGTMEERIDRLLAEKLALADRIIGSGDEWLTNLSTQQLREYLTLSKDAIGDFESGDGGK